MSDLYCQQKVFSNNSTLYYSFLFLPPVQKKALIAIHAFVQEVFEILEKCTEKDIAKIKLSWWQEELERIYAGLAQHPVGQSLQIVLNQYSLPKHLFEDILRGVEMDLRYQGYQTFDDLRLYCHYVSSSLELLSSEILGYQDKNTLEFSRNLGLSLKLITIIPQVGQHARNGYIYLPEEELKQFSVTPQDILKNRYSENFFKLMQFQANRARKFYHTALNLLPPVDYHTQKSKLIMAKIYFTLLTEIEKMRFQVLNQQVELTPLRKLWIAWRLHHNPSIGP